MDKLKTQSVPALERGLTLLELLAKSKKGLGLAELARALDLPKSSVHCLVLTLERCGYLERNDHTHRYLFGLKLFSLANLALTGIKVREVASPHLHNLMERTHLTVHMAILEQSEAVLVERIEPPGLLKLATWIGKRMDVHCTSVGKALIAFLSERELDGLIKEHALPRHNENTITSARRLREELRRVRRLGYALDDEEDEVGLRCLGAPIFDHTGRVSSAISIAGTSSQLGPGKVSDLAGKVKQTANAISRELGFVGRA